MDSKIETPKQTCIPPKLFKRNEYGLLCDVNYVYNENGTIDWRKMISPEFLVPNKQYFERKKKTVPTSIEGLEDRELIILLGGIKELAQIRGYEAVNYKAISPSHDFVSAVCSIVWLPNYETEDRHVEFSAMGDAHPQNTNNFVRNYLSTIAENRSFVRCVRNFLRVNIVSQEEIGDTTDVEQIQDMPKNVLALTMKEYGISFEQIKTKLITEKLEGAENFKSVDDIPKSTQFELIGRIKTKAQAKAT